MISIINLARSLKTYLFVLASILCSASSFGKDSDEHIIFNRSHNSNASLELFLPKKKSGDGAIIVCSGGGYKRLATIDAVPVATWLNSNGITVFLLRYSLPKQGDHSLTVSDANNAIGFVRKNASHWQINPAKIAVMGFSAGGHLASTIATHSKSVYKPNYQILIYPVITMKDPYVNKGSRDSFLGEHPRPADIALFSNEQQVTRSTPPAFVFHAITDTGVLVENSDLYVASLKKAKVPVTYIRVPLPGMKEGGHGMGLDASWTVPLLPWLREYHF
jgi:acetyl esterase/lipase